MIFSILLILYDRWNLNNVLSGIEDTNISLIIRVVVLSGALCTIQSTINSYTMTRSNICTFKSICLWNLLTQVRILFRLADSPRGWTGKASNDISELALPLLAEIWSVVPIPQMSGILILFWDYNFQKTFQVKIKTLR